METFALITLPEERFRQWRDDPDSITQAEHERSCYGLGFVDLPNAETPSGIIAARCPVCRYHARSAQMLAEIQETLPARYLAPEWDDLELLDPLPRIREASDDIKTALASGHNAVFHGAAGAGKTQAAALLAKAAIRAGASVVFSNLGWLAVQIRAAYGDKGRSINECDTIEKLGGAGLLVLDDLGAAESAGGTLELRLLYLALERRQNERRVTVITTNLPPTEFAAFVGQRCLNRLMPLDLIPFEHVRNFRRVEGATVWTSR